MFERLCSCGHGQSSHGTGCFNINCDVNSCHCNGFHTHESNPKKKYFCMNCMKDIEPLPKYMQEVLKEVEIEFNG